MLVYIEYISRRPGVSLEAFHEVAGRGQTAWAGEYGDDQLVLNVGRTWRIGPEPEYVAVWYNAAAGLERIADWERIFTSGEAARFEEPFKLAARIDAAGCYEPLLAPVAGERRPVLRRVLRARAGRFPAMRSGRSSTSAGAPPGSSSTCSSSALAGWGPIRPASPSGASPPTATWRRSPASSTAWPSRFGS